MHLGGRLNENQGTNKACNNVLWQAGYKTGQTLLHLQHSLQYLLFFFLIPYLRKDQQSLGITPARHDIPFNQELPGKSSYLCLKHQQVWSLGGKERLPQDLFHRAIWIIHDFFFFFSFCACMRVRVRVCTRASHLKGPLRPVMDSSLRRESLGIVLAPHTSHSIRLREHRRGWIKAKLKFEIQQVWRFRDKQQVF